MSGISKESTISRIHSQSTQNTIGEHKRTVEKIDDESFKKWMYPQNEEEETKPTDDESPAEGLFALPLLDKAGQTTACSALCTPISGTLPLEIAALFEKMASTMIVMHSAEMQETSLVLDGAQFASSPFFGTRITIKEFSTAPKVFNIEIASQSAMIHLLETHTATLLAAFEGGKFAFGVHRLETVLHPMEDNPPSQNRDSDNDEEKDDA